MWLLVIIFTNIIMTILTIMTKNKWDRKKLKKLKIFGMKKNTAKLNARGNICAWREPVIAK